MTHALTSPQSVHISAERADRMTAWWPRSPELPVKSRTDRDQIAEGIDALSQPCDPAWLMARVLALLTPYFTASVPEAVRVLEAEDWRAALHVFPHWAVEKAVRWWKSDANPDHRRKPLEGDIVGRVKLEMGIVSMGRLMVRRFDEGFAARHAEPEREPPTPEEMAHRRAFASSVMQSAGFQKHMDRPTGPRRETVTDEDMAEMAAILNRSQA